MWYITLSYLYSLMLSFFKNDILLFNTQWFLHVNTTRRFNIGMKLNMDTKQKLTVVVSFVWASCELRHVADCNKLSPLWLSKFVQYKILQNCWRSQTTRVKSDHLCLITEFIFLAFDARFKMQVFRWFSWFMCPSRKSLLCKIQLSYISTSDLYFTRNIIFKSFLFLPFQRDAWIAVVWLKKKFTSGSGICEPQSQYH